MTDSLKCLRCQTPMEPGFMADATSGKKEQEKWAPGIPQVTRWVGLHVDNKELVPVTTLRCPNCGMLESYAHSG